MSGIIKHAKSFLRSFYGQIEDPQILKPFSEMRPYKSLSTFQLIKAYSEYSLYRCNSLVVRSKQIYNLAELTGTQRIFFWWVKHTMGAIFTAGTSIKSIENYSMETQTSNKLYIFAYINDGRPNLNEYDFEENTQHYIAAIEAAARTKGNHGISINFGSLMNWHILDKISIAQAWARNVFTSPTGYISEVMSADKIYGRLKEINVKCEKAEFKDFLKEFLERDINEDLSNEEIMRNEWMFRIHAYYFSNVQKNSHPLIQKINKLTPEELSRAEQFTYRTGRILETAKKSNIEVFVESGYAHFQDAYDSMSEQFSHEYNKDKVLLINTVQNYLKSTKNKVAFEIERSKTLGIPFALRLEYGSHFFREWDYATQKRFKILPVYESNEEIHKSFEANAREIFRNLPEKSRVIYEARDKRICDFVTKIAHESGIKDFNNTINFYATKGIGDYTLNYLIREGFRTYRVLPYGETENMLKTYERIIKYLNRENEIRESHVRLISEELLIRFHLV